MSEENTEHPRDDDRNDEVAGSPVPDPEEEQGDAEDDPHAIVGLRLRRLVRFRVVGGVAVPLLRRVGHGRLVDLLVPIVLARVFHILFAHEGRPARQHRA